MSEPNSSRESASLPPGPPDNPYNINYERERRLKVWFFVLIAAGFVLAALLVFLGFLMDSLMDREVLPPPRAPANGQTTAYRTGGTWGLAVEAFFTVSCPAAWRGAPGDGSAWHHSIGCAKVQGVVDCTDQDQSFVGPNSDQERSRTSP
jgi:hypothetical protein